MSDEEIVDTLIHLSTLGLTPLKYKKPRALVIECKAIKRVKMRSQEKATKSKATRPPKCIRISPQPLEEVRENSIIMEMIEATSLIT